MGTQWALASGYRRLILGKQQVRFSEHAARSEGLAFGFVIAQLCGFHLDSTFLSRLRLLDLP